MPSHKSGGNETSSLTGGPAACPVRYHAYCKQSPGNREFHFAKNHVVDLRIDEDPSLFGPFLNVGEIFNYQMCKAYVPSLSVNAYVIFVNC